MEFYVGNKVRWSSAAGVLTGSIVNISLSPASSGKLTPWVNVKITDGRTVRLCGTDEYLKMMKFESIL